MFSKFSYCYFYYTERSERNCVLPCQRKQNTMERESDVKDDDGIPRFNMPMILMQSVLVPEYSNAPDQVKPVLPCLTRRVCSKPSLSNVANHHRSDSNTCRLPFNDGETLSGYNSSSIGRRMSARPLSNNRNMSASSAKIKKENMIEYNDAKKRLDRNLHAEHRVFMENLKVERKSAFRTRTMAAVIIQRYMRGLSVRMKATPEKYALLRASLVTHYNMEELSKLVADAIGRCRVTVTCWIAFEYSFSGSASLSWMK